MSDPGMLSDEDAEIDAMAARDIEPAYAAAGYDVTTAPRGRRKASGPTHFAIVERPGPLPAAESAGVRIAGICRKCNQVSAVLHQHPLQPNEPARTICGSCQGAINRERM